MKMPLAIPVLLLSGVLGLSGQEHLRHLYLGNDTHTDLMWNGDEELWYRYTRDMADFYLNLGEQTSDREPGVKSTWNYDVAWALYMLEKRTQEDYFDRIIRQIRNGQASVPFNFTLSVYGASTAESVIRSLYYGGHLERKYGIDLELANSQENATLPLGLASLWAGAGARYSWKGVCNCATKVNTVGQRDHEIYWYTGLDGARVLMKWYSNAGWNAELGDTAKCSNLPWQSCRWIPFAVPGAIPTRSQGHLEKAGTIFTTTPMISCGDCPAGPFRVPGYTCQTRWISFRHSKAAMVMNCQKSVWPMAMNGT